MVTLEVTSVYEASGPPEPPSPIMCIGLSFPTSKLWFSAFFEKFDLENYLLWCQQMESVIKAHKLHHFLLNPSILVKFLALDDANCNRHLKPGKTRPDPTRMVAIHNFSRNPHACHWMEVFMVAMG